MVAVQLVLESMTFLTKKYAIVSCCSWRFCCCASSLFVCLAGASAACQMWQLAASDQCWRAAASGLPLPPGDVPRLPAVDAGSLRDGGSPARLP